MSGDLPGRRSGCGMTAATQDDIHWQEARDRVLLYLKKLGMPALLSLEIAHRTLSRAAEEAPAAADGARPAQLAMQALHRILAEEVELLDHTPLRQYSILYRRWQPERGTSYSCEVPDPQSGLPATAMPPINRGSMNIRKI